MSRQVDNLPSTARAIALLLSSTPAVHDAQPGVLHQLLEFSHRYTQQVLTDARIYADHAGRTDKVEYDDVVLAVQARVGWEFGGRVPKEYILSLASQINATPLPPVPEVFGVRLPQSSECLTSIDFDLVPNNPPPGMAEFDEIEEIIESESEDDEDMEPAPIPYTPTVQFDSGAAMPVEPPAQEIEEAPFPISAIQDVAAPAPTAEEGSDAGDHEDLFGGEDEDEGSDAMEEVQTGDGATNGVKRKLVEEDDYD